MLSLGVWSLEGSVPATKDVLQALGSLAAHLIEPSLLIWSPDTVKFECLRGRDSMQRGDHEIIYLAWILSGFFEGNPIFGAKISGETEIQALDCRNSLNGPRVHPEPKLIILVSYAETEI